MHDTVPKQFLKLFTDNGYKIGLIDFFDKNFYTFEDIVKKIKTHIDLYIIYSKILE